MFRMLLSFVFLLALVFSSLPALAHGHKERPRKTAILLVAFGSSVAEARPALERLDAAARARFPGLRVHWAYSSKIIRKKVLAEEGLDLDSPAEALARLMEDDVTHVAVQSLQTIPGEEFHGLLATARRFEGMPKGFQRVAVGLPLLGDAEALDAVAQALLEHAPRERNPGEALVFLGHGTSHAAHAAYPALAYFLKKRDPLACIGAVEGRPDLADVTRELKTDAKAATARRVWLLPFMAVAGDHALNDMAGDDADSWKSGLEEAGFQVTPVLRGTLDNPALASLWLDRLEAALRQLE